MVLYFYGIKYSLLVFDLSFHSSVGIYWWRWCIYKTNLFIKYIACFISWMNTRVLKCFVNPFYRFLFIFFQTYLSRFRYVVVVIVGSGYNGLAQDLHWNTHWNIGQRSPGSWNLCLGLASQVLGIWFFQNL